VESAGRQGYTVSLKSLSRSAVVQCPTLKLTFSPESNRVGKMPSVLSLKCVNLSGQQPWARQASSGRRIQDKNLRRIQGKIWHSQNTDRACCTLRQPSERVHPRGEVGDGRRYRWSARRKTQTVQNLWNGIGRMDRCHNFHTPQAARAFQNVKLEHALHQFRPCIIPAISRTSRLRCAVPRTVQIFELFEIIWRKVILAMTILGLAAHITKLLLYRRLS
jgi:hypothetical protein